MENNFNWYNNDDEFDEEDFEPQDYEEIFETFRENYHFFDFGLHSLDLLERLEPEELNDKEYLYEITPLLNEIANYALIDIETLPLIFGYECEPEKEEIAQKIFLVGQTAAEYMQKLEDDECTHPSVLKYVALLDAAASFEQIVTNMHKIKNYNDIAVNISLMDFFNEVYAPNFLIDDNEFYSLVSNVERLENYKHLIHYIAGTSVCKYQRKALLNGNEGSRVIYYDNNEDSKFYKYAFKVNVNPMEFVLSDTMSFLDALGSSDIITDDMRMLVCETVLEYKLYKQRQFNYIYESHEEAKVLNLCQ